MTSRKQRKTPAEDPLRNEVARSTADQAVIPPEIPEKHSTADRAAAEAKEWVGTPYHHQASVKGVGCDCLGLLRGVYRAVVGEEPERAPNYSPAWDEVAKRDDMIGAFRRHLTEVPMRPFVAGDVVIFRMRRDAVAKHCGIVTDGGRFVHSHSGRGTVEIELSGWWQERIAGLFVFPEPSASLRKV